MGRLMTDPNLPAFATAARFDGVWEHDADGWHFVGGAPGPAGLVSVELQSTEPRSLDRGTRLFVDVDVAEPDRIVGIWAPRNVDERTLEHLVELLSMSRWTIGRLALTEDLVETGPDHSDLGDDDVTGALAVIDYAIESLRHADLTTRMQRHQRVVSAVDAAHAAADDLLDVPRPVIVASALRELGDAPGLDDPVGSLAALADALDEQARDWGATVADELEYDDIGMGEVSLAAPMAFQAPDTARAGRARRAPVSKLLNIVDLDTLPVGVRADQVAARATSASEIEVRIGAEVAPGAWWVRAHRNGELIVAAAPLRPVGDGAVARLLIPQADRQRVVIDLTDRPGDPRQSATTRQVVNAVRAGRRAARSERAERREADEEWRDTARAWHAVGDDQRADQALDRTMMRKVNFAGGRPLLSDLPIDGRR